MIEFARQVIKSATIKVGIPEKNIIDLAPDSITLPKPRLDIQFLPEVFTKTGRTLAINKSAAGFEKILSVYEARLGAACNIYTTTTEELEILTTKFIKALPRKFANAENNVVKLWVASGQWKVAGGAQVGLTKIEPIKSRLRLIRVDFIYHITEDRLTPYMKEFNLKAFHQ